MNIAHMKNQEHGHFGLIGDGNVGNISLPNPLVVPSLQNIAGSA